VKLTGKLTVRNHPEGITFNIKLWLRKQTWKSKYTDKTCLKRLTQKFKMMYFCTSKESKNCKNLILTPEW